MARCRGLSIKTAGPGGDEFPAFKAFRLKCPQPVAGSIVRSTFLHPVSRLRLLMGAGSCVTAPLWLLRAAAVLADGRGPVLLRALPP